MFIDSGRGVCHFGWFLSKKWRRTRERERDELSRKKKSVEKWRRTLERERPGNSNTKIK